MRGAVAHLTAEGTREGRRVLLSHPLPDRTLDEARRVYKAFAPLLPPDVVWRTDLPRQDASPDPRPGYSPATHEPQEGTQ